MRKYFLFFGTALLLTLSACSDNREFSNEYQPAKAVEEGKFVLEYVSGECELYNEDNDNNEDEAERINAERQEAWSRAADKLFSQFLSIQPLAPPIFNYRFEHSPELLMAAEVVEQYVDLFYISRWRPRNPLFNDFAVDNVTFEDFKYIGTEIAQGLFYWAHTMLRINYPEVELTEEFYHEMLGNVSTLIYAVKRVDIDHDGRDDILISFYTEGWGSHRRWTEVLKWCHDSERYARWLIFGDGEWLEVIQIDGINFIIIGDSSGAHTEAGVTFSRSGDFRFFDILHIQGNEARGIRVGYDNRTFDEGNWGIIDADDLRESSGTAIEMDGYSFVHPRAFGGYNYDLIFNLILDSDN